ncbi:hypothetical protein ACFO1B_43865 [Dactylosporangium siamense]|uniref:Uncharacterized protein n=1 Tax=Dactylosporangium siamense TaxID=685454 RepID=A0A919Q2E9_9ACTN|nr:hypothetical protein [Dactylosporangium siamense]GIG53168.1 hypothetical protein Dsi01nite_112090 [Dactylosporangium siamense]
MELLNSGAECRVCTVGLLRTGTHDAAIEVCRTPQLTLLGPGLAAQIKMRSDQPAGGVAGLDSVVVDDPRVCPPAVVGQQALFTAAVYLRLRRSDAQRISGRAIAGFDRALECFRVHCQIDTPLPVSAMRDFLRLVLAVREAEGAALVDEMWLSAVPVQRHRLAAVLRDAGLLLARRPVVPLPRRRAPVPRSCSACHSWAFEETCTPCKLWRGRYPGAGRCERCGQPGVNLADEWCRRCHVDHRWHPEPTFAAMVATQLWFGGGLAPRLLTHAGVLGRRPSRVPPYRGSGRLRH